jgi:hypothetical protein
MSWPSDQSLDIDVLMGYLPELPRSSDQAAHWPACGGYSSPSSLSYLLAEACLLPGSHQREAPGIGHRTIILPGIRVRPRTKRMIWFADHHSLVLQYFDTEGCFFGMPVFQTFGKTSFASA